MPVVKKTTKKAEKTDKAVKNKQAGLEFQKKPFQLSPASSAGQALKGGVRGDLNISVYGQDGSEKGNMNLPSEIFGVKINKDLINQAVRAQMANSRENIAHAKDRSEVRGGGKKPWKQKGTGRARHASIRSPLWAGGGVTFGPRKEKNFAVKINKKMKRQALLMVLSGKVRDKELIVLDGLKAERGKTKEMAGIVKSLKLKVKSDLDRSAMIVMAQKNEMLSRAARNLPKISTIGVSNLNIVDLLAVKYLVMTKGGVERIKEIYLR